MAAVHRRGDPGPARRHRARRRPRLPRRARERFALDLSKPARAYSTGNRQKIALIAAFATRAPLLVLDEPASGLDPLMELQFRRAVAVARDNGQTIFLCSHQLAEVEAVCDRVAILRAGRLVDVAAVGELRRLHRTEVTARFTGPQPDLHDLAGIDILAAGRGDTALHPDRAARTSAARPRRHRHHRPRRPGTEPGRDLPRLLRRDDPMTATALPGSGHQDRSAAGRAVTRLAVRQVRRGAFVVLTVAVGMSTLVAATYARTVGGALDPGALAALARNPAIRTLFGEPAALDTVGGFTVWRTGTVLAVLLSTWGLLATTRITRGEEEAGRWDLLLAGRLSPTAVLGRHLAVLTAAMTLTGAALAAALTAVGTPARGAVLHATGLALVGTVAVAAASLAAQVFPTRAAATGGTLALLGAGLLARMIGDGVPVLGWLRWLPPYGPLALTRPYRDDRLSPVVVLALTAIVLSTGALTLAGRRDVRDGLLSPAAGRPPRLWLLGSVETFAIRRLLRPLAGWSTGISAYLLLIGLLAVPLTGFLADNPRFADLAAQAGFAGLGTVHGYAATLFALLAVPVGAFTAVRLAAFAAAETSGRLTLLHAGPVTRTRLLGAEVLTTAAGAAVLVTVAGVAAWLGATLVGADLPLRAALAGTWNVLPVALLSLAAAALALGRAPHGVAALGMVPTAGGFLLTVVADSIEAPGWLSGLSPYAHLAAVPQAVPDWPAAAVMIAVAGAVVTAGLRSYQHRDMRL